VTRSQNTSTDLEEIQGFERKMQDEDDNQLPIMMEVLKVRQFDINMSTHGVKRGDSMSSCQTLTPIPSMGAYDDP